MLCFSVLYLLLIGMLNELDALPPPTVRCQRNYL
jgi:hypothetical protein